MIKISEKDTGIGLYDIIHEICLEFDVKSENAEIYSYMVSHLKKASWHLLELLTEKWKYF